MPKPIINVWKTLNQLGKGTKGLTDVWVESTDQMAESTKKMSEAEVIAFGAIMSAYEGGIARIISVFERWAAAAAVKWVMTKVAFPANLILAPFVMAAVKGLFSTIKGLKTGGKLRAGEPAIVGESGPEIFVSKRPGKIIPLESPRELVPHSEFNVYLTIHVKNLNDRTIDRSAEKLFAAIERQKRRRRY